MAVANTYSTKKDVKEAVKELKNSFSSAENKFVLYFASSIFLPDELAAEMQSAFPDSKLLGCSTAGEITSGKVLKNSLVAMSFGSSELEDVEVTVIERVKEEDNVKKAFEKFEKHFGEEVKQMDVEKYVGIILFDGMVGAEEKIMDIVGDSTNLTIIGGSAGDDVKFKETHVFVDGKSYMDAAVVALLKTKQGFDIIKTQSFEETGKKLKATKVDESSRKIVEFDGRPATEVYAEVLGASPEQAADHFMENPVGLIIDNEPFVRSPQRVDGKSICFYCQVKEGTELSLLKSTDIVVDTKKAVEDKLDELGHISAIINFHCILRTLELENKGQTEAYGEIFTDIPTIGFSTYGEQYIGHVNQTSTMLVLK
ncbi:FIST C-terminal domain-containing protein [Patescibacteria group bacterium]|nr:FIST C-terminal domain-containing protein [Patescibacteria group bacterium]